EATQRGLQNIEEALVGPANQRDADGSFQVSGFVADVGRLPLAFGTDAKTQLAELWSNPNNLAPFGIKPASADPADVWQRNLILPGAAGGPVTVRFFGPGPLTGNVAEATPVSVTPTAGTPVTYTFASTIGPRVLRAYQGATGTKRSPIIRLMVRPGGQTKD